MQGMASGYVLGEILSKLNMQPDFNEFVKSDSPEALINNFTRLQPSLTKLGLKLDSKTANAIMREEKGAAAQLLYGIKQV